MKIKDGYMLRTVAGTNVVVDTKGGTNLNRMLTLNSTGAYLWRMLENGAEEEEMVKALATECNVSEAFIKNDVAVFLQKMRGAGVLE